MNHFHIYGSKHGSDKVLHHGYHFFYPRFLDNIRFDYFKLLEIGYGEGWSKNLWKDYFPNADVFIADILECPPDEKCNIFVADQSTEDGLFSIVKRVKNAKVIIDDGSHNPNHQILTFEVLFKNLLEPGGVYIIEDIECGYWDSSSTLYGYNIGDSNSVNYIKKYIHTINEEFSKEKNDLQISTITFGQNCIIITKQTQEEVNYFNRYYRHESMLPK